MKKRVVVIGSGIGGCACAALLAKGGCEVTLLEAHAFPGGRCASLDREGFRCDFGVHMFSLGERGPHGEVNRRIGGGLRWVTKDPPCRVLGKAQFDFPLDIKPLRRQAALARGLHLKLESYPGAFGLIRSMLQGKSAAENDHIRLRTYVTRYTEDPSVHLFVNCVCQLYFALSYEDASAGEFISSFSRMFQAASFGYPAGGGGEIPRVLLQGLKRYGGRVLFNTAAHRIQVEGGRARGVEAGSDEYPADIVISNAGLLRTVELVGRKNLPEDYVKRADGYRYSNSYITIKYALERPVIPYPVVFCMPDLAPQKVFRYIEEKTVPVDPYIFMPVPTNHDPALAPPGRQLVIAGTPAPQGSPEDLCNAILDRVHAKVCELFPQLEPALLWQSRSTSADATALTGHRAGEAIGLAQTPDQVGVLRPSLVTPVEGLYLVGADAGATGIGTEMASASALRLSDLLLMSQGGRG